VRRKREEEDEGKRPDLGRGSKVGSKTIGEQRENRTEEERQARSAVPALCEPARYPHLEVTVGKYMPAAAGPLSVRQPPARPLRGPERHPLHTTGEVWVGPWLKRALGQGSNREQSRLLHCAREAGANSDVALVINAQRQRPVCRRCSPHVARGGWASRNTPVALFYRGRYLTHLSAHCPSPAEKSTINRTRRVRDQIHQTDWWVWCVVWPDLASLARARVREQG
jgi:hypothetical protein